jgi:hypothetical protein
MTGGFKFDKDNPVFTTPRVSRKRHGVLSELAGRPLAVRR